MSYAPVLFAPIADVRDVLETFLAERVLLPHWRETLASAAEQVVRLGTERADSDLTRLGTRIEALAGSDLQDQDALVRHVATEALHVLRDTRVPGLPRPDDADWS